MQLTRLVLFFLPLAVFISSCAARVEKVKQPTAVNKENNSSKVRKQTVHQTGEKPKLSVIGSENKTQTLTKKNKTALSKKGKTSKPPVKAKSPVIGLENKTQTLPEEQKKSISKKRNKPPTTVLKNQKQPLTREKEKKTPKEVSKNEIPRRELVEIAKLAAAKRNPVVRKEGNFLIEAIPKKGTDNCNKILVKVKNEKLNLERDYSVLLCGEKVEVKPD